MRILIVNAFPIVYEALRGIIDAEVPAIEALHARDMQIATKLLSEGPRITGLIVDIGYGPKQVLEALQAIRERHPQLLIATSSMERPDPAVASFIVNSGAIGHIVTGGPTAAITASIKLMARGLRTNPSTGTTSFMAKPAHHHPIASLLNAPSAFEIARTRGLTIRQFEVLQQLMLGHSNKRIARDIDVSPSTVKAHVSAILRALKVETRTEAIIAAHTLGILTHELDPSPVEPHCEPRRASECELLDRRDDA
jgi:DNA-binding NarL/FixJ family response regulator